MAKTYLVEVDFGLRDAFGKALSILTEEEYQKLREAATNKQQICLGEIEGKHSNVAGPIELADFKILSTDTAEIEVVRKLLGKNYGAFNIMDAIEGK